MDKIPIPYGRPPRVVHGLSVVAVIDDPGQRKLVGGILQDMSDHTGLGYLVAHSATAAMVNILDPGCKFRRLVLLTDLDLSGANSMEFTGVELAAKLVDSFGAPILLTALVSPLGLDTTDGDGAGEVLTNLQLASMRVAELKLGDRCYPIFEDASEAFATKVRLVAIIDELIARGKNARELCGQAVTA